MGNPPGVGGWRLLIRRPWGCEDLGLVWVARLRPFGGKLADAFRHHAGLACVRVNRIHCIML